MELRITKLIDYAINNVFICASPNTMNLRKNDKCSQDALVNIRSTNYCPVFREREREREREEREREGGVHITSIAWLV